MVGAETVDRAGICVPASSLPSLPSVSLLSAPLPQHCAFMHSNYFELLSGQQLVITAAQCTTSMANLSPLIFLARVTDAE